MYVILNKNQSQGVTMEFIQEIIAHNLATIRKSRQLSLDRVAEVTGVSKAMLAQIENGKSNPTVTTLWKIANGLQVSFSAFLKEIDKPKAEVINIKQIPPLIDDDGNYLVYSVFPFHPEKRFEIFSVDLKPGTRHLSEEHAGEEYVLVQQGKLTLEIHREQYELTPDVAMKFSADSEHAYINASDESIRFYVFISYPE
jgi:transcriptional regulator with XRE-family HTH domain